MGTLVVKGLKVLIKKKEKERKKRKTSQIPMEQTVYQRLSFCEKRLFEQSWSLKTARLNYYTLFNTKLADTMVYRSLI